MTTMPESARHQFAELSAAGMDAKNAGDHGAALAMFAYADEVALLHGDAERRLHALNPAARALWSLGRYDEAKDKLAEASAIAGELGLADERAIAMTCMGRVAAVQVVRTVPIADQRVAFRDAAVPYFATAGQLLHDHGHLAYRYANAGHGSVVAAMAGERTLAARLIDDGLAVALRRSPEPYDRVMTYRVNPRILTLLGAGALLTPLGDRTPVLANVARSKLIR